MATPLLRFATSSQTAVTVWATRFRAAVLRVMSIIASWMSHATTEEHPVLAQTTLRMPLPQPASSASTLPSVGKALCNRSTDGTRVDLFLSVSGMPSRLPWSRRLSEVHRGAPRRVRLKGRRPPSSGVGTPPPRCRNASLSRNRRSSGQHHRRSRPYRTVLWLQTSG